MGGPQKVISNRCLRRRVEDPQSRVPIASQDIRFVVRVLVEVHAPEVGAIYGVDEMGHLCQGIELEIDDRCVDRERQRGEKTFPSYEDSRARIHAELVEKSTKRQEGMFIKNLRSGAVVDMGSEGSGCVLAWPDRD